MQIAFATYRRNEPEIAKDIFVLAMEDASAVSEFGGKASRESLRQKMREAIAAGDYDEAANYLEAMEGEDEGEFIEEEPVGEGEGEDEEAEGTDEMPPPDLAPAQVASLVTLARKIRADGHPDLAKRITQALGL
jgi:hypothetical protein